jgi:hypothetical protein
MNVYRFSENAARQFERQAVDFEDLSLGENRPSRLVQRYGSLYSQSRIDALDALDDLPELADCDDLKVKLLFSILVVRAFSHGIREFEGLLTCCMLHTILIIVLLS